MRLAPFVRTILAPLVLAATAAFANATIGGSAHGRFQVVSPRSTALAGLVRNAKGQAIFRMDAILIGQAPSGALLGRWTELPQGKQEPTGADGELLHLEYELIGQYVRDANGVVRIEAQIYLDLRPQGIDVYQLAGEMQGVLRSQPNTDAAPVSPGWCPGGLPGTPLYFDAAIPIGGTPQALSQSAPASLSSQGTFSARYVMF